VRAAYAALLLGLLGGLSLATAVLSTAVHRPATVAEALGLDAADPTLDDRRASAVAALTAACMARQGLTWRPVPERGLEIPDPELDPVAWADRWGFGVSTTIDRPAPPGALDANMAAFEAMPAPAKSAYGAALHGSPGRPGCHETASQAVYGLRDRLMRPIRAELDALDAAVAADQGIASAVAAWRDCVSGVSSGFIIDRRSLPGALLQRFASRTMSMKPGSRALDDLQAEERRVAGVVARCEVAYASARSQVAARHEAAFVATRKEVLAGIGAAIRSGEAALPTRPP